VSSTIDQHFDHEEVTIFRDPDTGVVGVIAIHSTALGPAMGGLRLFPYPGLTDALIDVLRLARAMSFKSAAAGLDLGGGKAVLIDDGRWSEGRRERMQAVGREIDALGGDYVTAEDVGTTPEDMDAIAEVTGYVAGGSLGRGGSGNPGPFTARTVFSSIESGVRARLARDSVDGVRVGVQGVGNTGSALVGLLTRAGAEVTVTDADPARSEAVGVEHGARVLPPDGFMFGDFDVLAPCALGEVIGPDEASALSTAIIAGAANNPLTHRDVAGLLAAKGVLYVPDFISNCGGIIHVGAEALGLSDESVEELLDAAQNRCERILDEAVGTDRMPLDLAEEYALRRIDDRRKAPS
jgi:glutamate dehydrogenase/leucine dehydrogenase